MEGVNTVGGPSCHGKECLPDTVHCGLLNMLLNVDVVLSKVENLGVVFAVVIPVVW